MDQDFISFKENKYLESDNTEIYKLNNQIIQKDENISLLEYRIHSLKYDNELLIEKNKELISITASRIVFY